MLDEYFIRTSVIRMVKELKSNERYFKKKNDFSTDSFILIGNEVALYIFYDALYKYKIIIDDEFLFDDYLDQVEKLYRKLDSFESIKYGINKLICSTLITKLGIKDISNQEEKEKVVKHVYDKYIRNGYFIHGFNSIYVEDINKDGFAPEIYENIINKDFNSKDIYFTDDVVLGCYYSNYAPLFYYKFLFNEECFGNRIRKDNCLISDYSSLTRHLKRFMNNNNFSESDKKYILDLVYDEYKLIHRSNNKISLLLVRRDKVFSKDAKEIDFLNDKNDLYEVIDRMLSPKYNNLEYDEFISKDEFNILELDCYYDI